MIPNSPREPLLCRHIHQYNEQNLEIIQDFESSDLIQIDVYTS